MQLEGRRNLCKACATAELSRGASASGGVLRPEPGVVVVQQQQSQQQQQTAPTVAYVATARSGNGAKAALWIVGVLLILSGLSGLSTVASGKDPSGYAVLGLALIVGGVLLLPPVLAKLRKEKADDPEARSDPR